MKPVIQFILLGVLLSSCAGKFSLQKRRYMKGLYFASHKDAQKAAAKEESPVFKHTYDKAETVNEERIVSARDKKDIQKAQTSGEKIELTGGGHTLQAFVPVTKRLSQTENSYKEDGSFHKAAVEKELKHQNKANLLLDLMTGYYAIAIVIGVIALIYLFASGAIALSSVNWLLVLLYLGFIALCIAIGRALNK